MASALPRLGVGMGYRVPLHQEIMNNREHIDFLEVVTDQYIYAAPEKVDRLIDSVRDMPVIPHGVALSVGTDMPIDTDYLEKTAAFVERTNAAWFSDHLSFTKVPDIDIGQLTPLWFTEESLDIVCRNVNQIKAHTDTPFLLENITYYFPIPFSEMTEAEFITRVLERTDCGMLLDVNNVHINSINLGYDPHEFLKSLPLERVVQLHIAGGRRMFGMLVDTHGAALHPEVWELLDFVVANAPVKGIILERDHDFPDFQEIVTTLKRAKEIMNRHG
jgi:uncharacterized protein